ncbi:MAG: Na+/H+ antiporter NhaC family protein [Gemmatimonadota bacterium]
MTDLGWISLLPPLLAIALAIASRQVYLSLAAGIWLGGAILEGWHPFAGLARAVDMTVAVLADAGSARAILFTLVIGSLIATVESAGGVRGFVNEIERRSLVTNARRAQLLPYILGILIFIESNITVLVAGAIGRPLFDRFRVSREKLAYIIDSTSAAVCIMIPLNAWGAYVLGLLGGLGVANPLVTFGRSMPYNFYAIGAIVLTGIVVSTGWNIGPMRRAEERSREGRVLSEGASPMVDPDVISPEPDAGIEPRARNMILPILAMVAMMPVGLYVTGGGDVRAGSGSTSVLWAVLFGLAVSWALLLGQRAMRIDRLTQIAIKGAGGLIPMAVVLLLALSLADVAEALGTGAYVAQVVTGRLAPAALLPLIFVVAGFTAFSTGTSWGTFAIMMPIAVPTAVTLGLPVAPFVAASLSGGIFGDHSSPISDTTIISSMASATDHVDHVRTQLPYALIAGGVAAAAFAIAGATM